jgi:hypothetical protein
MSTALKTKMNPEVKKKWIDALVGMIKAVRNSAVTKVIVALVFSVICIHKKQKW